MFSLLSAFLHFAVLAHDPHWTCELTHRDPGVAGTFYLYCSQMTTVAGDRVELVDVGHFISDKRAAALNKTAP
jgi:hypothetical protein